MPQTSGLPHSRDAEEALIGGVLINPECFHTISAVFQKGAEEFYIHRLRFIWEAFARLDQRKVEIDSLTVSEELEDMGRLEEVGGPAFLTALLNQCPTTLHVEAYAKIVVNTRVRRNLLTAANRIAELAYDEETEITEVCTQAVGEITDATVTSTTGEIRTAREVFSSLYDRTDELSRQPADILPGISTGFTDLDRHFLSGGWKNGQLIYVGARPGEGKTAFLLSALQKAAYDLRKKTALFSLEMDAEDNAERLVAMEQSLNTQIISTGKLDEENWGKFNKGIENGSYAPIFFDDTGYLTPSLLRARCKRIQAMYGLDLVIVDYVGLMAGDRNYENRNQELSAISRSLKNLARELKIPVLAALQLNREVEKRSDGEPMLSDLRDTGSFEQDGDIVMFLWTDKDLSMQNVSHCKVSKQRKGPKGQIDLLFRREFTKFESLARRELSPNL
jgi:replicative DNA helicase